MSSAIAASEDHLRSRNGQRISDLMLTAVNEDELCAISPSGWLERQR